MANRDQRGSAGAICPMVVASGTGAKPSGLQPISLALDLLADARWRLPLTGGERRVAATVERFPGCDVP
jgi:hypothetical protein